MCDFWGCVLPAWTECEIEALQGWTVSLSLVIYIFYHYFPPKRRWCPQWDSNACEPIKSSNLTVVWCCEKCFKKMLYDCICSINYSWLALTCNNVNKSRDTIFHNIFTMKWLIVIGVNKSGVKNRFIFYFGLYDTACMW